MYTNASNVVRGNINVKVVVSTVKSIEVKMNPVIIRLEKTKTCRGVMNLVIKTLEEAVQVCSTDKKLAAQIFVELSELTRLAHINVMRLEGNLETVKEF